MSVQTKLLHTLADGQFHSGEQLAEKIGVTRAAIWKQVKKLQDDFQLDIHSVTGRGYRLSEPVELISADQIQNKLVTAYDVVIESYISIDSTSRYLMKKETDLGTSTNIVFAELQTAGRGRQGRKWVSPFGGNLYFSIMHQFASANSAINGLSLAVGVAIVEFLETQGLNSMRLKWPNDILVNDRKLCGILLEMKGESHGPGIVVIGVGLNIRMQPEMTNQIDQPWTCLENELSELISRNELATGLLSEILRCLNEFEEHGLGSFLDRWSKWDAYRDTKVTLTLGEREITGIARGIDQHGALLIEKDQQIERYYSGEISLRTAAAK